MDRIVRRILATHTVLDPVFEQIATVLPSLGGKTAHISALWGAEMGEGRWVDYAELKDLNNDDPPTQRVVKGVPITTQYVYVSYLVEVVDVLVDTLRRAGAGPELQIRRALFLLDNDATFRRQLREALHRWFLSDTEGTWLDPKFVHTNWLRFPIVQRHVRAGYRIRRYRIMARSVHAGLVTSVGFEVLVDLTRGR